MITIPSSDINIKYLGRFLNTADYKQAPWQSSQIKFKVRQTSKIIITADIKDISTSSSCFLAVSVDDGGVGVYYLSTNAETYTGERTATVTMPDSDEHTIIIKTFSGIQDQFSGASYIRFKNMQIDDTGELVPYAEPDRRLMCIGDSWMAMENDFPRFMHDYSLYPVAFGGAKATDIEPMYPYILNGAYNTDVKVNAVIIMLGINDYWSGVQTAAFKTTMTSLVNKVKVDQTAQVFLIQAPRNTGASKNYDKYGTVLSEISSAIEGVTYVPTSEIWSDLVWDSDECHLDSASKQLFSDYISFHLDNYFVNQCSFNYYFDGNKTSIGFNDTGSVKILLNGEQRCLDIVGLNDANASDICININGTTLAIGK